VTYSDARFAYEEAQFVIDSEDKHIPADISLSKTAYDIKPELVEAIITLNTLSKIMRKERMNQGAISFDKEEVKFYLDEDNNPKGVYVKTSQEANKLIEEFMLLANRKVSEFIGKRKLPKNLCVPMPW